MLQIFENYLGTFSMAEFSHFKGLSKTMCVKVDGLIGRIGQLHLKVQCHEIFDFRFFS